MAEHQDSPAYLHTVGEQAALEPGPGPRLEHLGTWAGPYTAAPRPDVGADLDTERPPRAAAAAPAVEDIHSWEEAGIATADPDREAARDAVDLPGKAPAPAAEQGVALADTGQAVGTEVGLAAEEDTVPTTQEGSSEVGARYSIDLAARRQGVAAYRLEVAWAARFLVSVLCGAFEALMVCQGHPCQRGFAVPFQTKTAGTNHVVSVPARERIQKVPCW